MRDFKTNPSSNNNVIKYNILKALYEIHKKSTSIKSISKGIKEIQKLLKDSFNYKQQVVTHHLDYLLQKGWVKEEIQENSYNTGKRTLTNQKRTYKISQLGIEIFEENSAFHNINKHDTSINISGMNNVVVTGNGNMVNANYSEIEQSLNGLKKAISETEEVSEEEKLNILSDITTIQNQLVKPVPTKSIIKTAWDSITSSGISKVASIAGLINNLFNLIKGLIS